MNHFKDSANARTDDAQALMPDTTAMLCALRLACRLHVGVLLAFMSAVAAAGVAPWLGTAPTLEVVCSDAAGLRLVVMHADGSSTPAGHGLECPLCLPLGDAAPLPLPAAAAPVPTGDAPGIARRLGLLPCSSALRPPARAPPRVHPSIHKVTS